MSGKRQHYIPKFILDGFSHRVNGVESYCWVYRGPENVFESNTKNVGVEGYFYGESVKGSLDEKITRTESQFIDLVRSMKINIGYEDELNADHCIDLVNHLSYRTQHFRSTVLEVTSTIASHTQESLSDRDTLVDFAINSFADNPEYLEQAIDDQLNKIGIGSYLSPDDKSLLLEAMRNIAPSFVRAHIDYLSSSMSENMRVVSAALPSALKSGHNEALAREDQILKSKSRLSHLSWSARRYPDNALVLGDCPAWAVSGENNEPSSLVWANSEITLVVLPVAHDVALIGTSNTMRSHHLDSAYLNETSAALSKDFVVCSKKPDSLSCAWVDSFATRTTAAISDSIEYSKTVITNSIKGKI